MSYSKGKPETRLWNKSLDSTIKHQKYLTQYRAYSCGYVLLNCVLFLLESLDLLFCWEFLIFLTCLSPVIDSLQLAPLHVRNKAYNRMRKSRLYCLHQDNLLFCPCRQVSSRDSLLRSFGLHLMIPMDLSLPLFYPAPCQSLLGRKCRNDPTFYKSNKKLSHTTALRSWLLCLPCFFVETWDYFCHLIPFSIEVLRSPLWKRGRCFLYSSSVATSLYSTVIPFYLLLVSTFSAQSTQPPSYFFQFFSKIQKIRVDF